MADGVSAEKKSVDTPDQVREMPHGKIDVVTMGPATFMRAVYQPGWRWSESAKPIMKTDSCEAMHHLIVQSGSLHVSMNDGTTLDIGPGDAAVIAPGHDAWVTGDEPVVIYDFGLASHS
jgi:mannose-6-phosphate isomerase-like protein (cupin superfamily)